MRKIMIAASIVTASAMLLTSLAGCASEADNQVQLPQITDGDTTEKTDKPEETQSPVSEHKMVTIAGQVLSLDAEELTLNTLDLTDEEWDNIGKLGKLRALTVNAAESIEGGWEKISGLSRITELTVTDCKLTHEDWENVGEMSGLKKLDYDGEIDNVSVLSGLVGLESLTLTNLYDCKDISPLTALSKLTSLKLGRYDGNYDLSPIEEMDTLNDVVIVVRGLNIWEHIQTAEELDKLTGIEIYCNIEDLENIPEDIDLLKIVGLEVFSMNYPEDAGKMGTLPINRVWDMKNLTSLSFTGRYWSYYDLYPMNGLTKLTSLYVSSSTDMYGAAIASSIDLSVLDGLTELRELSLYCSNSDISALSTLKNLEKLNLSVSHISDLSPLAGMTKLKALSISFNYIDTEYWSAPRRWEMYKDIPKRDEIDKNYIIDNISALKNLTSLESLSLGNTGLNDISDIGALANLKSLSITVSGFFDDVYSVPNSSITDLSPLNNLTKLKSLTLINCYDEGYLTIPESLSDRVFITASSYYNSKLFYLDIGGEYYQSAPGVYTNSHIIQVSADDTVLECTASKLTKEDWANVLKMENLTELTIREVTSDDFARLGYFKKLEKLTVYFKTDPGDVGGDVLTEEIELSVLSDLSLLTELSLNDAIVSGISALSRFEQLTALGLNNCYTEDDVAPIGKLTGLTSLELSQDSIFSGGIPLDDISFLAGLNKLEYLNLNGNRISDLSPLANMTGLKELYLSDNVYIMNVMPLSRLTKLEKLGLYYNGITDISALSNMTKMKELNLGLNIITDVSPLAKMTELTFLNLAANEISDISPLYNLDKLQELNIGGGSFMQSGFRPNLVSRSDVEAFQQAHPDCEVRAYIGDEESLQYLESYADFRANWL